MTSLIPQSAASRLIPRGMQVSFDGNAQVIVPKRSGTPATLPWVGEGNPIPLQATALGSVTIGQPKKMGIITAFTRELAKRAMAQSVFETLLREDAAKSLDAAYFSDAEGTADGHAGLLYDAESVSPSGDMKLDLANLARAVATGGSGEVVFVTGLGRAATIPIIAPELSIPVWGSLAVDEDRVIGIDPGSLVHGFGAEPDIDASIESTLHMADDPAQAGVAGSPNVVAASLRSMFQTDFVALRAIVDIAFGARRTGAVAFVDVDGW